jgi:hypothetical protein
MVGEGNTLLGEKVLASPAWVPTQVLSAGEKHALLVTLANIVREFQRPDNERPYLIDLLYSQLVRKGGVIAEAKIKNEGAVLVVYPSGTSQFGLRQLDPEDVSDDGGAPLIDLGNSWDMQAAVLGTQRVVSVNTTREQFLCAWGWQLLEDALTAFYRVQPDITTEVAAESLWPTLQDTFHMKVSPGIYYTGDEDNFAILADILAVDVPQATRLLGFEIADGNDMKISL